LRYGDLGASDARVRALPSRLELRGARILLRVDASGARFPVRIDPLVHHRRRTVKAGHQYLAKAP
jgi:hypothetical protein